jgi:hypothetical protein
MLEYSSYIAGIFLIFLAFFFLCRNLDMQTRRDLVGKNALSKVNLSP